MMRQYELVERVRAYDANADEALLNRAYVYATKMHGRQKRWSGDPYFSHPVEVAGILTDLRLDSATIAAAVLHDTLEDTDATYEELDELFGEKVARLVDGVTKLTRLELGTEHSEQAENFRKLLLAVSDDIRVLLIKLADRLHNMRTLHYVPVPEKRRLIAQETMEIYGPLAGRMGMQEVREELEDYAFGEINPEAYQAVNERLSELVSQTEEIAARVEQTLRDKLAEHGIKAEVYGRAKKPYSIWRKMERKSVALEQLSDIIGFRIIVEKDDDCYRALGIVHRTWTTVPGRFKDYVSVPKRNDYRSLHTTVIGPADQRVELQIRTQEMHEVAERGIAAHWVYKDLEGDVTAEEMARNNPYRWLRETVEMLKEGNSPEEFLEDTKLELFADQVFCFTPKGRLIALPAGATPVDFAYAVHTEIGQSCVACRINGRHMPLRTQLKNGDEVELVTSKTQGPLPIWEAFVVTGKARAAIRRFARDREREEFCVLGEEILRKAFAGRGLEFSEKEVEGALERIEIANLEELYERLGRGQVVADTVVDAVAPPSGKKSKGWRRRASDQSSPLKGEGEAPILIKGLTPGVAVHLAECCHPLPGDRIVGIVTPGRGITVHTLDCAELEALFESPERWIEIAWDADTEVLPRTAVRIGLTVANEMGTLGTLSTVIARNEANISNLSITGRTPDFFEMEMDIEVKDVKHLTSIIAALRTTPVVNSVDRLRG